ncbi:sensor histidine kinase [Roseateles chitosanitabidus]|uniref:sensor histidine kinase n=1 Tax=Roseateles chitosanitabidus TaxID=65048 RepID=UPI00082AC95F|nr:ATP-binding protein [Roseateles chitosanitabidus]
MDTTLHTPTPLAPPSPASLARELHDDLGQRLTVLHWELHTLQDRHVQGTALSNALKRLRGEVEGAQAVLRDVLNGLRAEAVGGRLPHALHAMIERMGRHCAAVIPPAPKPVLHLNVEAVSLDDDRAQELLRLVQEAVMNAIRHAQARHIQVSVNASPRLLAITIADDGCGFDPLGSRRVDAYGLVGMRERAELLRASLTLESEIDRGTRIRIALPLMPRESAQ